MLVKSENNKRYRHRQRERGLCMSCGNASDTYRCDNCRAGDTRRTAEWRARFPEKRAVIILRRREKYIEQGRCLNCGADMNPDADSGRLTCINCREKRELKCRGGSPNAYRSKV